ncbi:stage III sporulation protein AE [Clostridium oryzae]|uniref:Stage III sporulation protein AE n=1 Tax=Clostridium oryzae TaxID=1450648 RepID=A0A1V4IUW2_9CLOT|nr:stage III sporulation protein AE [Clostridium oryzae]OPJ63207.1 stage III sporulation protein AE precursor [Clostridium oryzae]
MRKLILFLVMLMLFSVPVKAYADESNEQDKQQEQKIEQLYDYVSTMKSKFEVMKDLDIQQFVKTYMKTGNDSSFLKKLYTALLTYTFKEVVSAVKLIVVVIIIAIIAALLNNLQNAFSNDSLSNIAFFACYAMLIIVLSKSFLVGLNLAKDTINSISNFMLALLPVLVMLIASVGGITQAASMDPIIIAAVNICTRFYVLLVIPMILMGFVLQFVNNVTSDGKVDKLAKSINKLALWLQGGMMTGFVALLTIRGITSKTLDEVTVKTAKFAVDNFIPVVGKCLSDAISTVAGYTVLLKNALSAAGLIIVVIVMIFPIIKIFIIAAAYKLTGAIIEPISDKRIVNSICSVGDSLILINSCLISISIMFFILISILASSGQAMLNG